jgi:hypothetical protein
MQWLVVKAGDGVEFSIFRSTARRVIAMFFSFASWFQRIDGATQKMVTVGGMFPFPIAMR